MWTPGWRFGFARKTDSSINEEVPYGRWWWLGTVIMVSLLAEAEADLTPGHRGSHVVEHLPSQWNSIPTTRHGHAQSCSKRKAQ